MIGALVFVQSTVSFAADYPGEIDEQYLLEMEKWFGSTQRAMLVLFKCTTGGVEWGPLYDIVAKAGLFHAALFIMYILFFIFALFNIVTSIFVDRAMRLAQPDAESSFLTKRREDMQTALELRALIEDLDEDGTGLISYKEMKAINEDPRVRNLFEKSGVNIRDASMFFQTLTRLVGQDALDIDSFVAGSMKVKGYASSLDVQAIIFQVQEIMQELIAITETVQAKPVCRRCRTPLTDKHGCPNCGMTPSTSMAARSSRLSRLDLHCGSPAERIEEVNYNL